MSWHPYNRKRRVWNIYWEERKPAGNGQPGRPETTAEGQNVVEFEITEPYALNRDELRDLQVKFLSRIMPEGFTLNVSQLWSRYWPVDGAVLFSKINDVYKLPIILSAQLDTNEQPGKREDYFWVLCQVHNDLARLADLFFIQNVDFENVTWITSQPIEPFPDEVYEFNKAAFAWNRELVPTDEFDQLVRRECWGVSVSHLSHLYFLTTRARRSPEQIMSLLQELAAEYELELETTTYDRRPEKPGLLKSLVNLPGTLVQDGWGGLKERNKRRP